MVTCKMEPASSTKKLTLKPFDTTPKELEFSFLLINYVIVTHDYQPIMAAVMHSQKY